MKNGKLERKDEDTLKEIYKKLTVDGYLKEPLTVEEQVSFTAYQNGLERMWRWSDESEPRRESR